MDSTFTWSNNIFDYWLSLAGTRSSELYTLWTRASSRTYLVKTLLCCKWSNVFQLERGCQLKTQCNRKESFRRLWKLYSKKTPVVSVKCFSSLDQDRSCKMSISSNVRSPTVAWNQWRSLWSIPASQRAIAVTVNQNATWWFPSRTGMENSR